MSHLTFLVAESFIAIAALLSFTFTSVFVADKWAAIVTGFLQGAPISARVRDAMLFGFFVPYQWGLLGVTLFLALIQLEMANHVTDANAKLVAYVGAFLLAIAAAFHLLNAAYGTARLRAKVRRAKVRQAEAD